MKRRSEAEQPLRHASQGRGQHQAGAGRHWRLLHRVSLSIKDTTASDLLGDITWGTFAETRNPCQKSWECISQTQP